MVKSLIEFLINLPETGKIFLTVFLGWYLVLFVFRWLLTGNLLFVRKKQADNLPDNTISLITVVRNEEQNIKEKVGEFLISQKAEYEWVIVDDFSQDNSYSALGVLRQKYVNLKLSALPQETRHSYKLAENIALKAAANKWAMVVPAGINVSPNYIESVINNLDENKSTVLFFTNTERQKSIFNLLYRIEKFFLQLKSMGFTRMGLPFVYFEENVAFQKTNYFNSGGFGGKMKEPFANLELVINRFLKSKAAAVNLSKECIITESIEIKRKDYFELIQKSIQIEKDLKPFKKFVLFFYHFLRFIYLPLLIVVFSIYPEIYLPLLLLIFLRIANDLFIIKMLQNRLKQSNLFIPSLVYEVFYPYLKFFYRLKIRKQKRK